jgi:DNA phosphorothioation-dependent restriction protein DptG
MQTKKLSAISWDILDGTSVLASPTSYGYAGHFDDPNTPSNDLNFGSTAELFYTLTGGDLSPNQFNVYWSPYMAEITNKDSKLMKASFYLKPTDILALDFSKYIYVDGVLFRLNKITDYNMSKPDKCAVELLKRNNVIF